MPGEFISRSSLPLVVAITAATEGIYGVTLLRVLKGLDQETHLILSEAVAMFLRIETDYALKAAGSLANGAWIHKGVGATAALGFCCSRGVIVAHCPIKTRWVITNSFTQPNHASRRRHPEAAAHSVADGAQDPALQRSARFQEPRRGLGRGDAAADQPRTIIGLIQQIINKALYQDGIEHHLFKRWARHGRTAKPQVATWA